MGAYDFKKPRVLDRGAVQCPFAPFHIVATSVAIDVAASRLPFRSRGRDKVEGANVEDRNDGW